MRDILHFFVRRWLRLIGGLMVFTSLALLVSMLLLDLIVGPENPYLGIVTYMVLPTVLGVGLLLVPLDSFLRRRRIAAGRPEEALSVSVDLTDPSQRNLVYFFGGATMLILVITTVATYKGIEFMDTKTFCGLTCHRVMIPEYTAYTRSPHASVRCVECHIGPGAPWFVRAKLSGIPQVYHYLTNTYERPVPTPVAALRPSRETCENCHWPEQFYGSALRTEIGYAPDRNNSMRTQTMTMRVGSGAVRGSGIHSHIVQKIWYLPANARRTQIAWARVKRVDGSVEEYVSPSFAKELRVIGSKLNTRFMDCIDCHNRPAHEFVAYESLVDLAMTQGELDRAIPYLKREALEAVPNRDRVPTAAQQARTLRRIAAIPSTYRKNRPDVYAGRAADIAAAARTLRRVYLDSAFPHMRISADTYPNWVTHEGCFRCHGALVKLKGEAKKRLDNDCLLCHSLPQIEVTGVQIAGDK